MVAGLRTQGVQFLGMYWGLAHGVASGLGSLVIALNPVVTAALMAVVLRHRESRRGALALVLATAAVVLACAPKIAQDHSAGPGIAAVVVAMLGLSAGGVYQGRHCSDLDPCLVSALGLTASTPLAGAMAALSPVSTSDLPRALTLLAAMVVFSSVGAMTLYSACLRQAGARATSILFAVIPALASVLAWTALGEELSPMTLGGLTLGAAACALQARAGKAKRTPPEPESQDASRPSTAPARQGSH
jgi:drug/metabolite transporter (DMT)-like permease